MMLHTCDVLILGQCKKRLRYKLPLAEYDVNAFQRGSRRSASEVKFVKINACLPKMGQAFIDTLTMT